MIANLCPICGNTIPAEQNNCPTCGEKQQDNTETQKKKPKFLFLLLFAVLLILAGASLVPGYIRQKDQGLFNACQSNCKNIGTILEFYATDHKGHYPDTLHELVSEGYMKEICKCHAANRDTYSSSYTRSPDALAYTFYCEGKNHMRITRQENYPQYNSNTNLIDRPKKKWPW